MKGTKKEPTMEDVNILYHELVALILDTHEILKKNNETLDKIVKIVNGGSYD